MGKSSKARVSGALVGTMIAAVLLAGCQAAQVRMNPDGLDRGLVVVLPGIDGRTPHSHSICAAIARRRPDFAIELYDWTLPLGPAFNQRAIERNHTMAEHVARRIQAYRRACPGQPVFLVGHSGGTAIAIWAAEALPEGQTVDGMILLASSLSPGYDLSPAIRRCEDGIVSFHSKGDFALLGVGTTVFGTMDGQHCEAAGKVGFHDRGSDYGKLRQIAWRPEMAACGHDGGHFSCAAEGFVFTYVAPLMRTKLTGQDLVAALPRPSAPELTAPAAQ